LPDAIKPTTEWRICNSNLARVVRNAEFLFSSPALEDLCSCANVQELVALLTHVFESLSQRDDRDWQPMAIFVLEMAASRAVYRRIEESIAELEEEIGDLKSVRGQLMRRCRTLKEDQRRHLSQTRVWLSDFTAQLQNERQQAAKLALDMKSVISPDSDVRAGYSGK
jgi:hypothetical protein